MVGTVGARVCVRLSGNVARNRQILVHASRTLQTSSPLHRSPNYPGHIPLNPFENAFLTVGSALMAFMDTRRSRHGGRSWRNYSRFYITRVARRDAGLSRRPSDP
ncbi:hypothetical protein JVT61DRAFT_6477 [Boletus reticuloceps]|uniref:Uncharacterized protein n=1 Tax=Boletus reticuloceps TaxID=495285 RepID=A0A8I2YK29_9AGAM|nr:hypothetical protein JVT61DRAFT_6477 [Boletus reticuloceps]